jgi:hypothetical protein
VSGVEAKQIGPSVFWCFGTIGYSLAIVPKHHHLAASQLNGPAPPFEVGLECQKEESMTREIKKYKPIGFGDRPDPDTVEGHRNAEAEAAETRRYNLRMSELAGEDKAKRVEMLSRVIGFFTTTSRRITDVLLQSHRS